MATQCTWGGDKLVTSDMVADAVLSLVGIAALGTDMTGNMVYRNNVFKDICHTIYREETVDQ